MSPTGKPRVKTIRPPDTPPKRNPWDVPPLPSIGDESPDLTYVGVGHALSSWEYFEGALGILYGTLVGGIEETSPTLRAYGVVSGFSTRRDMINEASTAYFFSKPSPVQAEISSLLNESKEFATRRNEIAHGIIQPYYVGGLAPSGFVLGPSRFAVRKRKLSKHPELEIDLAIGIYAYTNDLLIRFSYQFNSLSSRCRGICAILSESQT
jgi:hypothetical protein